MKIVVSHSNADLDALACMIAATRLYDDVVAVGGNSISPPVQRFLALHKDRFPLIAPDEVDPNRVEQVIVVDVRDRRRLKPYHDIFDARPYVIAWDHHPRSEWDVDADEETVAPVGACITLFVEALRAAAKPIPSDEATLYLLGLYSDTGRLSYTTTNPRDLQAASYLLEQGAQLKIVNRYMRHALEPDQSRLLIDLLATVEEISIDRVEVAIATATTYKTVRGASTVVQQVMELGGHDAMFGVILFEKNSRVQIIGRSRVSYLDIGEILSEFGGGGHHGAGAASVKNTTLDAVVEHIREVLRNATLEATRVAEIMTSPVHSLAHDVSLDEAFERLHAWGVTGAPVFRDGRLAGVVSRRDIRRAQQNDNGHLPVSSHMAHHVLTVDHNEPVEDALEMLTDGDVGRMPVCRDGEMIGIVTRTDLIRELYMKVRDDSDLEH